MELPYYKLSNGVEIPAIGIGMDQVKDFTKGYDALIYAFSIGYRSVDTAFSYGNEEVLGKAIKDSGIPRDRFYISTKLTNADHGYDATLRGFEKSLKRLGVDYIDSYLIHWPGKYLFVETWKAFEHLYTQGLVRCIGVCNFTVHHLETLINNTSIIPMTNQLEWHPYFTQPEIAEYCQKHNILVEAWSPLMCGGDVLEDKTIIGIANSVNMSPAQVVLRWHYQQGRRIFPKSVTPLRIKANLEILDFSLTDQQMQEIDILAEKNIRIGPNPDVFFENY